jgi:peptidoglycan/LPS O-acetylase OafA/YrhL
MMAVLRDAAPALNIPPSLITGYLVITALMTVRPPFRGSRPLAIALMVLALAVGVTAITMGFEGAVNGWVRKGMPAFPFFMFGLVGLMAGISDFRVIRYGNPTGPARLVRHLWRMGFALFIAALSFFVGQSDELPEAIRIIPLLALPGLAVLVTMIYWIWRLKVRRSLKGIAIGRDPAPRVAGRIVTDP